MDSSSNSDSTSFPPPPDPTSSSVSCAYDVFLSFRGEDTRKSFVDHLYAALDRCGFYTFKDDERLRGGESISHKLLEAIEQSESAIVVFSKDYASSSWCLDELVKIMDQSKEENLRRPLTVFPIFYDVDPADVRRQTGIFGQGFAKAAERNADKADAWRKALQDASNLSGYHLRKTADGHESQCIQKVVEWCSNHSCNTSAIDKDLIGMPSRVRKLKLLLGRDLDDVRMIGIWGMGGVGKTTLAEATFHEVKKQFDGASFIDNVREKSKTIDGLQLLQKKIMYDILMDTNLKVDSVAEGKILIQRRLGRKKVLIVLDDVDDDEQLRALAEDCIWFGKGSRILITTRDQQLLNIYGDGKYLHDVDLLSEYDAILLFNRHAFKKCNPIEEYNKLTLLFVQYASGLPLALKVLGSYLCYRDMDKWKSVLTRLQQLPEEKILNILKISYNGLNLFEKEIFLHIACFFKEWKKDEVIRILNCCELHPDIGIDVLMQKSLISVSNEKVQMHDLLQEMGRYIGRQSRLWLYEDINDVLQNNTGTEAIEAIVMSDFHEEHTCDSKAFMIMKKLRLLHLYEYRCTSFVGPEYLPNELRWLFWEGYGHASLPKSFKAQKLVGLEMKFSSIVQLWEGTKHLDKLKILNLSDSEKLIRTPDFNNIPNLETLDLRNCSSLIEVHHSIRYLQRLVSLNLYFCENLVYFPSNIHSESLEFLDFSYCAKFERFPELDGNMDRLHLRCTGIKDLPSSIANLTKLVSIDLSNCKNLLNLPDTICTLKNLKELDLFGCGNLRKLPENLGHIESLEELNLSYSGVEVLPSSIGHLKKLRHVSLSACRAIILQDSMGHIGSCLKVLDLSHSGLYYREVDIGKLSFLEDLNLMSNPFALVPINISQLPRLKILNLSCCKELRALPELPSSIAILKANECTSLERIESLSAGKHEWLWSVSLKNCGSVIDKQLRNLVIDKQLRNLLQFMFKDKEEEEDESFISRPSDVVKQLPNLLQSMFQGNAFVNHQLHIRYSQRRVDNAILEGGWEDLTKRNKLLLKLPPNWQNEIAGLAFCFVDDFFRFKLSNGGGQVEGLDTKEVEQSPTNRDAWIRYISVNMQEGVYTNRDKNIDRLRPIHIGYISLKMIQLSIESSVMPTGWMDAVTQLYLKFPMKGWCAARIVCKEASSISAFSSEFACSSLQQLYDPYFAAKTRVPGFKVTADRIELSIVGLW